MTLIKRLIIKYVKRDILSIIFILTVVWPVKTRTRIFMPFFDWYGGEGSSSHRKIIIKGLNPPLQRNEDGAHEKDSSLLGTGRFSRVVRCMIKEESRVRQTSQSENVNITTGNETDEITDAESSNYSQEIAVKVIFSIH